MTRPPPPLFFVRMAMTASAPAAAAALRSLASALSRCLACVSGVPKEPRWPSFESVGEPSGVDDAEPLWHDAEHRAAHGVGLVAFDVDGNRLGRAGRPGVSRGEDERAEDGNQSEDRSTDPGGGAAA